MSIYFTIVVTGLLLLSPFMLEGSLANFRAHRAKWKAKKRLKIAKRKLKSLKKLEKQQC